jgi:hypothetical protein
VEFYEFLAFQMARGIKQLRTLDFNPTVETTGFHRVVSDQLMPLYFHASSFHWLGHA